MKKIQSYNEHFKKEKSDFNDKVDFLLTINVKDIEKMKKIIKKLTDVFALKSVISIFDNDEHKIISKKGEVILSDRDEEN